MLVERDQLPKGSGVDSLHQERRGGAVTGEGLVGHQVFVVVLAGSLQFGFDVFGAATHHKSLGLGKEVGQENVVVVADGVVREHRRDEITGNEAGALMNQLIECVLSVGSRLTPDDGTGSVVVDGPAVAVNALAVTFHVALLEVGGKAVEVLVVGENGVAFGSVKVVIPDADESHENGDVLREGSGSEVFVHAVGTGQEFFEGVGSDDDGDGKTDGRPQGVAASYPVPKFEHVVGVDAEFFHFFGVGREGHEV